jgi:hypothetical protein
VHERQDDRVPIKNTAPPRAAQPPQWKVATVRRPALLAETDGAERARLLIDLQRRAGNAAVQRLVAREPRVSVQRCGGVVHDGCPCAQGFPEERTGGPPTAATLTIQRFQDGTPDDPSPDLPPGSQYHGMDPELRATLSRTLLAKTYWQWRNDKPTNLGAALDLMGVGNINTLVQLKHRLFHRGLWGNIQTIKNVWTTSSLGIEYNGPSMQGAIQGDEGFCKDTAIGESYHKGSCWREVVQANTPGLHFCTPNEIHIDPHQTSVGHLPGIGVGGGGVEFGWVCRYSLIALISHMTDVEGGASVNVFHRYHQIGDDKDVPRRSIGPQRRRIGRLAAAHPEVESHLPTLDALEARRVALDPTLRQWALQGVEGGDAGPQIRRVLDEMDAIEAEIGRVADALDEVESPTVEHTGPMDF